MGPCRLNYRSVAKPEVLNTDALSKLANRAASNNRQLGVCGVLIVSDGRFLQVLESQSKFVNNIYAKIIKDKRHHDIELISFESVVKTEFHDWDMKLFKLDDIEEHVRELLINKYPVVDNKIQFIDDAVLMTSLLLDMKHLKN
ncbi:MAG: BLUF domain-containing protein [Gammaproteobacteria bacterium]|nr:BLUF domain-containing protein [Gammaproteobacteria bacterium]